LLWIVHKNLQESWNWEWHKDEGGWAILWNKILYLRLHSHRELD
jgi:hypothetical protein